ncbi:MAG: flagellar hook-associated protein FlgK, partial [Bdellovibrionales bacterium]
LSLASTPGKEGKHEGNFEIFYTASDGGAPVNVTRQLTGGEIGGLLQVRDEVINEVTGQMDELAYRLSFEVNRAHVQGYDREGRTGNLLFVMPDEVKGASEKINVSQAVQEDVGRIAAAAQPSAPGDNRIANILSGLQYKQAMSEGTATVDEFYNSIVGQVGIMAQRANSARDSQNDMVSQLKNVRESISGVSLDEETTKMIEFQKAFDASARLIRTADEMMDTVLNLKRM